MARKDAVPDAWDDDWETQADTPFSGGALLTAPPEDDVADDVAPTVLSRSERLAQHAEKNRRLWQDAETREELPFVSAPTTYNSGTSAPVLVAPLAFRTMTVLSRKPAPQMVRRRDPVTGVEQLVARDDDDEVVPDKPQETPEQMRQRQRAEREEKQRRYDEARAKIFGEPVPVRGKDKEKENKEKEKEKEKENAPSTTSSRQTSPSRRGNGGSSSSHPTSPHGGRGRGRGRGQNSARGGHSNSNAKERSLHPNPNSGQSTPASPAPTRELYDPNATARPGYARRGRGGLNNNNNNSPSGSHVSNEASPQPSRTTTPRERDDEFVTRAPRGPDGSGRGGFGFARRGGSH